MRLLTKISANTNLYLIHFSLNILQKGKEQAALLYHAYWSIDSSYDLIFAYLNLFMFSIIDIHNTFK